MFTRCSYKIDVFLPIFPMKPKICYLKIDVSCEASVNFHHMSQKATPATQFARCHHLTQSWQCGSPNTQPDTSKALCLPRKMKIEVSKVQRLTRNGTHPLKKHCTCHTERLSDAWWNMLEFHKAPRHPHETKLHDIWTSKSDHFCSTPHRHGHRAFTAVLRTVANGCGHKSSVERTGSPHPDPQSKTRTLRYAFGKHRLCKR